MTAAVQVLQPGGRVAVRPGRDRTVAAVQPDGRLVVRPDRAAVVEAAAPGPRGPAGQVDPEAVAAQVEALTVEALAAHPGQVYRFDDPASTWPMPHGFGRTPNVALYSPAGRKVNTDVYADAVQATAQFPRPTPGYAVLT